MKQKLLISFVCLITVLIAVAFLNQLKYKASFLYDDENNIIGVLYDDIVYYNWDVVCNDYINKKIVLDETMYPYYINCTEPTADNKKIYVSTNNIFEDFFHPNTYFVFHEKNKINCFIGVTTKYQKMVNCYDSRYVIENFKFPNISTDKVVAVLSSDCLKKTTEKSEIEEFLKCAKSNGKIILDKSKCKKLIKYLNEGGCIYFEYKDYPLIEEFEVIKNNNGDLTIKSISNQ